MLGFQRDTVLILEHPYILIVIIFDHYRSTDGSTAEKKKILEKLRVRGAVAINLRPATKIEVIININYNHTKTIYLINKNVKV